MDVCHCCPGRWCGGAGGDECACGDGGDASVQYASAAVDGRFWWCATRRKGEKLYINWSIINLHQLVLNIILIFISLSDNIFFYSTGTIVHITNFKWGYLAEL